MESLNIFDDTQTNLVLLSSAMLPDNVETLLFPDSISVFVTKLLKLVELVSLMNQLMTGTGNPSDIQVIVIELLLTTGGALGLVIMTGITINKQIKINNKLTHILLIQ